MLIYQTFLNNSAKLSNLLKLSKRWKDIAEGAGIWIMDTGIPCCFTKPQIVFLQISPQDGRTTSHCDYAKSDIL